MIDLSGQNNGLVTEWLFDENTGLLTITFYDSTKTVILGDLIIEKSRFRAFSEMMKDMSIHFTPEQDINSDDGQRTRFDGSTHEGVTKWE